MVLYFNGDNPHLARNQVYLQLGKKPFIVTFQGSTDKRFRGREKAAHLVKTGF